MRIKIQSFESDAQYDEMVSTSYADAPMITAELQRMLIEAFLAGTLETTRFEITFTNEDDTPTEVAP